MRLAILIPSAVVALLVVAFAIYTRLRASRLRLAGRVIGQALHVGNYGTAKRELGAVLGVDPAHIRVSSPRASRAVLVTFCAPAEGSLKRHRTAMMVLGGHIRGAVPPWLTVEFTLSQNDQGDPPPQAPAAMPSKPAQTPPAAPWSPS